MLDIGIIIASTRTNRVGPQVGAWVEAAVARRGDVRASIVDLQAQALPHLDEPMPAMHGQYQHAHTRAWSARVASLDALVFVTPEYNQGMPGVLKNAIDFLHAEWKDKAVGIVSYGVSGGASSAAQLRQLCEVLGMRLSATQVELSLHTDFEQFSVFTPADHRDRELDELLDSVVAGAAVRT